MLSTQSTTTFENRRASAYPAAPALPGDGDVLCELAQSVKDADQSKAELRASQEETRRMKAEKERIRGDLAKLQADSDRMVSALVVVAYIPVLCPAQLGVLRLSNAT